MINAAILGLGWWGQTIARVLRQSSALRLACAVDPGPGAAATAETLGLPLAPDLDAVLADPAIQAVILCTPHTLHFRQIMRCVEAGKHVFCEKPLCLTRSDAEAAVAASTSAGLVLGVGHERRFEPPIRALRQLVSDGALGRIVQIEANFNQDKFLSLPKDNWRLSPEEAPAGPMTATGIHLIDLAGSFLGPAETVLCRVGQLGSDLANGDTLALMLTYRGGGHALISAILCTPFDGRFAVYGSEGWAEVRDKAHPESPEGWQMTVVRREGGRTVQDFAPATSVLGNLEAFAAAAAGAAAYPMTDAEKIDTIAALEAAYRSARSGAIEIVAP